MKIAGIILIVISLIAAVGIFYLHSQEEDSLAKMCIYVFTIAFLIGIALLMLPQILHPNAGAVMLLSLIK